MSKTVLVWFSATGNTLALAKRFPEADLLSMTDINEGKVEIPVDTDRLGILYPVHCFGIPEPVRAFIRGPLASRDNSQLGYLFSVGTCGGMKVASEWILEKEINKAGLGLSYAATVRLPDAYLPLLKESPDEAKTKEILDEAEAVIQRIIKETTEEAFQIPKRAFLGPIIRKVNEKATAPHAVDKKMSITTNCVGCGVCKKVCPMDNLKMENGKAVFGDKCISCFACYHHCPEGAIRFDGCTGQYKGLVETKELWRR